MRTVLFTGKGGVGKTTAAAATGVLLGPTPTEVEPGLAGMQVDALRRFEAGWDGLRDRLGGLLGGAGLAGLDGLAAAELPMPPGIADVYAVLVDCAPTAETLRLLALPEALAGYLERVWPVHRRVVGSLRPVLGRLAGEPVLPPEPVLAAAGRLQADLAAVRALLTAPGLASVRLVLTPEAVVVAETRRMLTALALHGYAVDSLIANRVFPPEAAESPWGTAWRSAQDAALNGIVESVPGLAVRRATYRTVEPVGIAALLEVAGELYETDDPLGPAPAVPAMRVTREGPDFVLRVALPLVRRSDVRLVRSGEDLVITVGEQRRRAALPSVLRRCLPVGAAAGDGAVRVRFRPDPELWPRGLAAPGGIAAGPGPAP